MRQLVPLVLVFLFCGPSIAQDKVTATLAAQQRKREVRRKEYAADLEKLARWCEENGLIDAARETRDRSRPPSPGTLREVRLPRLAKPVIPPGAVDVNRAFHARLAVVQKQHARNLYALSREALRLGFPAYAMDLVREVAHHDPDNRNARRLLGYVSYTDPERRKDRDYAGEWVTPYEKKMITSRPAQVRHPIYGWIRKSNVAKYEQGLRPWNNAWITAEKEIQLRRDFRNAWEVRTEHFLVKTNYSLERGVEIAYALEDYYSFFRRTFATFFETPAELKRRFTESARSGRRLPTPKPMQIHYYRSKQEYVDKLRVKIPQIAMTEGLYYEPDRTSFFFHNPDRGNSTLYHEATHQFFDLPTAKHRLNAARVRARANRQSSYKNWTIGEQDNFWVVEGIACYMESFKPTDAGFSLGDPAYIRFVGARKRLLETGYYVPLAQFSGMGLREYQTNPNIKKNYTQGSGIVHFLMHYEGGRYRDALTTFLAQLYRPNLNDVNATPSLAKLTGVPYETLDAQYRSYTESLQAELSEARQRRLNRGGE